MLEPKQPNQTNWFPRTVWNVYRVAFLKLAIQSFLDVDSQLVRLPRLTFCHAKGAKQLNRPKVAKHANANMLVLHRGAKEMGEHISEHNETKCSRIHGNCLGFKPCRYKSFRFIPDQGWMNSLCWGGIACHYMVLTNSCGNGLWVSHETCTHFNSPPSHM